MLSALAHRMVRDHVHLWITFVFVSNTCVSLDITKTSPGDGATTSNPVTKIGQHEIFSINFVLGINMDVLIHRVLDV
jgi:hypothetical protein